MRGGEPPPEGKVDQSSLARFSLPYPHQAWDPVRHSPGWNRAAESFPCYPAPMGTNSGPVVYDWFLQPFKRLFDSGTFAIRSDGTGSGSERKIQGLGQRSPADPKHRKTRSTQGDWPHLSGLRTGPPWSRSRHLAGAPKNLQVRSSRGRYKGKPSGCSGARPEPDTSGTY